MNNNTFGNLSSAPNGRIVEHIYGYIISILKEFRGTSEENENAITNRLCKLLEFKKPSENPYFFHHQNIESETENTSTDFAAFGTFAYAVECGQTNLEDAPPIIKFEAKRLSSKLPKKREREYVIGEYSSGKQIKNSGGIERFKNGRHGLDVKHAGIIGYVQTDSFSHWHGKINNWICEEIKTPSDTSLVWNSDDSLSLGQTENNFCLPQFNFSKKTKWHN